MKLQIKNKFNKVYYTAEYNKTTNHIYGNWTGFITVEEVKEACLQCITLMEQTRCPNLLNDNSQVTGPWHGANEWIASVWMPKALSLGLKKFAHIVSPNIFAAMSVEQLVTKVEGLGFEMQTFPNEQVAKEWLLTPELTTH